MVAASTAEQSSASPVPPPAATPAPAPAPAQPPAQPVTPGGLVADADMAQATAAVAGMGVPDQAGMVVMANSAQAVGSDLVARLHLGGVILMGSNGAIDGTSSGTSDEVAAVTAELQSQVPASQAGAPLLIATDQEYGLVTRLVNGFTDFPGAAELSGIGSTDEAAVQTERVTAAAGAEMLAVGINVDFAPDADVVPASGSSAIGDRSFGSDPERDAALVAAAVRGYQSSGLAATIKHFPGIGRISADTHESLPTLDVACDEWNTVESVPMRGGVDAGVALVMTGHVLVPAVGTTTVPSSISSAVVTDLLRGAGTAGCTGLNFTGVTVSDAMEMAPISQNYSPGEAAWRAVAAGQDLVLMPTDPEAAVNGIITAAGDGSLAPAQLQQAATRVYALRLALARAQRPGLDRVGSADHQAIAAEARAAG
jgi:beta-N-acetylhexosaminidase